MPSQTESRRRSWAAIRLDRNDKLANGLHLPRLVYRRYWDRCLWCGPTHPITNCNLRGGTASNGQGDLTQEVASTSSHRSLGFHYYAIDAK